MKQKTSDNPTPPNLESGFSDDGAGTIRCFVQHVDLQFASAA
jgi:hypothetical protein